MTAARGQGPWASARRIAAAPDDAPAGLRNLGRRYDFCTPQNTGNGARATPDRLVRHAWYVWKKPVGA